MSMVRNVWRDERNIYKTGKGEKEILNVMNPALFSRCNPRLMLLLKITINLCFQVRHPHCVFQVRHSHCGFG